MKNPFDAFESVRNFYITYLETAFRIGDCEIQALRRTLLESDGTLCTQPFLEPMPKYMPSDSSIDDLAGKAGEHWLPGFTAAERRLFSELAMAGLIPSKMD